MDTLRLQIDGMSCGHCVARVERAVRAQPGVVDAHVEVGHAEIRGDRDRLDLEALAEALRDLGFTPHPVSTD